MTATAEHYCSNLLTLPEEDRAELARVLLQSLHEDSPDPNDALWNEELARREDDILNGRVAGLTEEEFFERLEATLSTVQ